MPGTSVVEENVTEVVKELGYNLKDNEPMKLLAKGITFILAVLAVYFLGKLLIGIIRRSGTEKTIEKFIVSAINFLRWFIIVMIGAGLLGVPLNSFVALISIAGLALSLSIQGLLSNLFSGLTVLGTRPFAVGDYVEMCSITGTVREVGLVNTTVVMPDNRLIYIPNSSITSSNIINYTREPKRRVDFVFSCSYDSAPKKVRGAIESVLESEKRILKDPAPFIAVKEYADTMVHYTVRIWVQNEDYWDVYHYVTDSIWESFAEHDIDMHKNKISVKMI